jgi:hypothetical protein
MSKVEKTMHSAKMVCVLFISIFFITATASAEESHIRDGFWGGIDAGAGHLKQSFDDGDEDGTSFFLGFKGGYTINPHFLIGLELSGWLIETSDQYCYYAYCSDASEGEGIMQVFLISRYYPSQELGFFVKAGGGYVDHWNNSAGESKRKNGWGLTVGGGYDFPVNEYIAISPFATFSYGETGNWDYQAITLGLGLTFP